MDTVCVGDDFHSIVAHHLALTRAPFVAVRRGEKTLIEAPHILTEHGVIFGLPAIVDFLLHRVPEPPLVYPDIRRRALQMTVFWALIDREYLKLVEATNAERAAWLRTIDDQLRCSRFYVGDELSLCDIALAALLETLELFAPLPATHKHYLTRCMQAYDTIQNRNKQVLNDDGA